MGASAGALIKLSGSKALFLNSVADCDLRVLGLIWIPLGRRSRLATLSARRSVNNR